MLSADSNLWMAEGNWGTSQAQGKEEEQRGKKSLKDESSAVYMLTEVLFVCVCV